MVEWFFGFKVRFILNVLRGREVGMIVSSVFGFRVRGWVFFSIFMSEVFLGEFLVFKVFRYFEKCVEGRVSFVFY